MQLTRLEDITTTYRHIFLSPHFDDVVLSCGGTLGVQVSCGLRPLVITVFGGIPATNLELAGAARTLQAKANFNPNNGAEAYVQARRKEDAAALDYLQVDYLWLDYLDAIYRGDPAYYQKTEDIIGGDVHPGDQWIDQKLAQQLMTLRDRLPDTVWYAPLGIGRHVDHQLVASAADRLVQSGAKVNYYEDFPYVLRENALDARLKELGGALEPALVEMSEMLPQRIEATGMYSSQIPELFGDLATMRRSIDQYTRSIRPVETVRLERYWNM